MLTRRLKSGIIISLALAFLVVVAISFYADFPHMILVLEGFRWKYLPLILLLTLFNYFLRFIKWQYYLKRLEISLSWGKSLLIFVSGLSMAITPGKVGELLKSYLVKRSTGAAISRTSPIIMAERLTDGLAMLGLAATGLVLYRFGWELLVAVLLVVIAGILVIQHRALSLTLLGFGERLPLISRIAHLLRAFYESSYTLLKWRPLLLAIGIGLVSWIGECAALYFVFVGLGIGVGLDLLLKATFILAVSSVIGSLSGLPGGLGTADGSMLGLTRLLVTPSAAIGGAATLLIRLCTLWFGLGLGIIALFIYRSTERTPIFSGEDERWGAKRRNVTDKVEIHEDEAGLQAASASTHTGETTL